MELGELFTGFNIILRIGTCTLDITTSVLLVVSIMISFLFSFKLFEIVSLTQLNLRNRERDLCLFFSRKK